MIDKLKPSPLFLVSILICLIILSAHVLAQAPPVAAQGAVALAPARFQLEMLPGTETTVVVELNHHSVPQGANSFRIFASLNDWTLTPEGQVEFHRAGTQPGSASSWMIYSPGELTVQPNKVHAIRVTVSVPKDAKPGDHLAALIIEPRTDTKRVTGTQLEMSIRFRMAAMFYITVPQATRRGSLEGFKAEATPAGVVVTPILKNAGNSMVRPVSTLKITDAAGRTVAELTKEGDEMPVLGNSEVRPKLFVEKRLRPGSYSVRYRVDFQDGGKVVEGVTDLTIKEATPTAGR